MVRFPRTLGRMTVLAALVGALAAPAALAAQERPDFLFRTPRISLGLRVGYALPTASSEIFDFTREQLTVERTDFASATWGGELAVRVAPRIDVAAEFGYASARKLSEMREFTEWVGDTELPIEQTTEFRRVPFTIGVKAYLSERGRSVGRFAWIPARWTPFVGAGAGWVWYRFEQEGDFVDYETYDPVEETYDIFTDRFVSDGNAPTIHLFGGADWSLGPNFFLTAQGRYTWARADMSRDFKDFDRMDLSGFQATAGISVRF